MPHAPAADPSSSAAAQAPSAATRRVPVDFEFPTGVGRGYPIAALESTVKTPVVLETGAPPPDFQLVLDDGRTLRLSDLAGRPVIVNFWASWCGPCRAEMPELLAAAAENPELALLAVNYRETPDVMRAFAEEFAMEVPDRPRPGRQAQRPLRRARAAHQFPHRRNPGRSSGYIRDP